MSGPLALRTPNSLKLQGKTHVTVRKRRLFTVRCQSPEVLHLAQQTKDYFYPRGRTACDRVRDICRYKGDCSVVKELENEDSTMADHESFWVLFLYLNWLAYKQGFTCEKLIEQLGGRNRRFLRLRTIDSVTLFDVVALACAMQRPRLLLKNRRRGSWPWLKWMFHQCCPVCGICKRRFITASEVSVDHVQSVKKDGRSTADNLQLACRLCNERKQDKTMASKYGNVNELKVAVFAFKRTADAFEDTSLL